MNSGTITNQLLDAVQVIVDDAVQKAKFDRTVQAVIAKCISASQGKYSIKYQGGYFNAYSQDPDITYSPNTQVYVLIPDNDMNATKTILGTVDRLGQNFIIENNNAAIYEYVGNNICSDSAESPYGLHSYLVTDGIVLYEDGQSSSNNTFDIDTNAADVYLKNSNYLIIGADIRAVLPPEHRNHGNYGIKYTLTFEDPDLQQDIDRIFILDINSMLGDPYNQPAVMRQHAEFKIDPSTFKKIKKIELFSKDFVITDDDTKPADIFISNVELIGANLLTSNEDGYTLSIVTNQGSYFNQSDSALATKRLEAKIYKNKKIQNNTPGEVAYYWFKENGSIYSNSIKYVSYGGNGWECINSYSSDSGQIIYKTDKNYIDISKAEVLSKEVNFKCVAVYKDSNIKLEQIVKLYNEASAYEISLTSSNGTLTNLSSTNLTCTVRGAESGHTLNYYWSEKIDDKNNFEEITVTSTSSLIVDLTRALEQAAFRCTVKDVTANKIIGNEVIVIQKGENFEDFIVATNNTLEELQEQIDGNITTWFYDYVPTLANEPASEWTTTTEKDNHLGDLFYDTTTGYCYRFMKTGNVYSWGKLSDSDIAAALAAAEEAQDTADNKRRVFVSTPEPPYDIGDLWVQGSTGDILRCTNAKEEGESYVNTDWIAASKYTDDSSLNTLKPSLVTSTVIEYALSDSPTTEPSSGWSTQAPTWEDGKYMWQRTTTTYADGNSGQPTVTCIAGASGQDSYSILLTNEVQSIAADSEGEAIATSVSTGIIGLKGATPKNTIIGANASATTFSTGVTGITAAISDNNSTNSSVTFTITNELTQATGEITIPIKIDGLSFNKKFTFSLSKQGNKGDDGNDGKDGTGIWTTTVEPVTPNYTFTISNLTGMSRDPLVGDVIVCGYYRYTISSVSTTTVLAGTRQNIRGAAGADGTSPYIAYLTNEAQTIAYNVSANTVVATTDLYAYQGTTEKNVVISKINNTTISSASTYTDVGLSNIQVSVSSLNGAHPTISFKATNTLTQSQTVQVPILYTIAGDSTQRTLYFSYSTTTKGADGTGASLVDITASSQIFKSTDGGSTFSPDTIVLTPRFQNVTYSEWQYSTNGGSNWSVVTSGQHGLTISDGILTIAKTCDLFTNSITTISFKCISSNNSVYDTITIVKMYDVTDIEIGGRNLLLAGGGTNTVRNYGSHLEEKTYTFTGWDDYGYKYLADDNIDWNDHVGEYLCYRCYMENVSQTVGTGTGIMLHVRTDATSGTTYRQYGGGKNGALNSYLASGESGWLQLVIQIPSAQSINSAATKITHIEASIRHNSSDGSGTVKVKENKVEFGNIATNWTPAPEDLAKMVNITASSQMFKSPSGPNGTYTPDNIVLTPEFQACSYSQWQYSTNNGTSWTNVTSGSNGLTLNGSILTIAKTSNLFNSTFSVLFKCKSNDSNVYDIITIMKLYDMLNLSIEITNDNQVFKYNVDGDAPTLSDYNPQTPLPIKFKLKNDGTEVAFANISTITWTVPSENTMIDSYSTNNNELNFVIKNKYDISATNNTINLQLVYLGQKIERQIPIMFLKEGENGTNGTSYQLKIVPNVSSGITPKYPIYWYKSSSSKGFNFNYSGFPFKMLFYKDGELVYDSAASGSQQLTPTSIKYEMLQRTYTNIKVTSDTTYSAYALTTDTTYQANKKYYSKANNTYTLLIPGTDYVIGNSISSNSIYEKVKEYYKYDDTEHQYVILSETDFVSYSGTKYESGGSSEVLIKDRSNFTITNSSNTWTMTPVTTPVVAETSGTSGIADILKGTLTYNNLQWHYFLPIALIKYSASDSTYNVSLKENSGFNEAMYSEDGRNPKYKGNNIFELKVLNSSTDISTVTNTTYTWSTQGKIYYNRTWTANTSLIFGSNDGLTKNQKKIFVNDFYDNQCTTNAAYVLIKNGSTNVAEMRIPIALYLNTYGNTYVNEWDGHIININEKGGVILTPQMAAGVKETDNTFTGIVAGRVKEASSDVTEEGLYGYNHGIRTIELNSKDGSARFGQAGAGQIIMDPSQNMAIIRSGDYLAPVLDENEENVLQAGRGMEINLTEPSITFGSGTFWVNKDGGVHAATLATADDLEDLNDQIYGDSKISYTITSDEKYQEGKQYYSGYSLTTDTTYHTDSEYFSKSGDVYTLMREGIDYTVGASIPANTVYVHKLLEAGTDYQIGNTIPTNSVYEKVIIESLNSRVESLNENLDTLKKTFLEQTSDQFRMLFVETGISKAVDDLDTLLQDKSKSWDEIVSYINFTANGIEIGAEDNVSKLIIGKDRISFMTGENESAYISDNQLYITDSTILNKLQVGHWETKEDANHNLNTRWVNE